jgi:acylphosphatase
MSRPAEASSPDPLAVEARLDATVMGRVQGVGYRWFVTDVARRLELEGWVGNEADGSVRCVAEGPRRVLEALLLELARGPLNARVDRVVPRWGPPSGGLGRFGIRSGAHRGD